jgi:hypothetical protein
VSTALGTPAPSGAATLNLPVISQPIVFARTTTSSTKFPTGTYKVTAYDSPDGCSDSYVLPSITLSGSTSHTLATDKFSLPAGKYIFTLVNGSNTYVTSTVPATSYTSFTTSTTTNTTVTTTS